VRRRRHVETAAHPIAGHVGEDDPLHALSGTPLRQCGRCEGRVLLPAVGVDLALAGINRHGDPLRPKGRQRRLHQRRVLHGCCADHHPAHAQVQCPVERFQVTQAAAELDAQPGGQDAFQGVAVLPAALTEGPVQVDDVKPGGTGSLPAAGDAQRVVGIFRLPIWVSLHQPHDPSPPQVYGRVDVPNSHPISHSTRSTKFRRTCKPTCWLFSGWNWTP